MDRTLVLRAQAGDHEAFASIVAASTDRLFRAARLILRDDEIASDAVQEALTSAWLDIRALRDPDRFDAWVHRLLVRACYREADRRRRHRVAEIHVDDLESVAGTLVAPTGMDLAVRDELDRAFRRLTPAERAALVVHHYLGLRDAEAARTLDIPLGTFKSRLHRATMSLRAAYDAEDRRAGAVVQESVT